MIDIDKLEALAKAATLGPYFPQTYNDGSRQVCGNKREGDADNDEWTVVAEVFRKCDQEYQVAANPDAILALITEVRALREDAELFRLLVSTCYALDANAFDDQNQPGTMRATFKHKTVTHPELQCQIVDFIKGFKTRADDDSSKEQPCSAG
jgi:hypothetical protein